MDAMSPEAFRRHGHLLSDRQLKVLVDEPCDGIRMAPTAELGWRWLEGAGISFDFDTAQKTADVGCRYFTTFQVSK